MKTNKFFALVMALMLVVTTSFVFAANTPEVVDTTATINLAKVLNPSAGGVFPTVDTFEFVLEPVSYTLASTGTTVADTNATYMPAGTTVSITVTENADGSAKEGTESVVLDFVGKEIGVYTYKLTETNGGVPGVEYDDSVYYVNVYVINQVDENNVPTGLVTVSDITAWKTSNMSDEALKALTQDWTGDLLDAATEADGKVGNDGGDNEIDYPFENEYTTTADLIVDKIVTGNYASTTQEFEFTVALTGLVANEEYALTHSDGTAAAQTVTADADGNATVTVKLSHGETFSIADLPSSTKYTITEQQDATYSGEYVMTDGNAGGSGSAGIDIDLVASGTLSDNGVVDNELVDEEITYTNNKEYITPTGIALSVLPFACGLAVVAVLVVATGKRRQED